MYKMEFKIAINGKETTLQVESADKDLGFKKCQFIAKTFGGSIKKEDIEIYKEI